MTAVESAPPAASCRPTCGQSCCAPSKCARTSRGNSKASCASIWRARGFAEQRPPPALRTRSTALGQEERLFPATPVLTSSRSSRRSSSTTATASRGWMRSRPGPRQFAPSSSRCSTTGPGSSLMSRAARSGNTTNSAACSTSPTAARSTCGRTASSWRRTPRSVRQPCAFSGEIPLTRVKNRSPSVLFSLLRPGAHIPPHCGLANTRLICHLPLIVPPGCAFRVGNDTRVPVEGRAWVFDDTIEHEEWNRSSQIRVDSAVRDLAPRAQPKRSAGS